MDTDIEEETAYSIDSTLIGKPNKFIHKRKIRKIIRYVLFNVDKNEQDFYRENVMLFLPWRDETVDLLNINCKQVYETHIDLTKDLYQQFNKVNSEKNKTVYIFILFFYNCIFLKYFILLLTMVTRFRSGMTRRRSNNNDDDDNTNEEYSQIVIAPMCSIDDHYNGQSMYECRGRRFSRGRRT